MTKNLATALATASAAALLTLTTACSPSTGLGTSAAGSAGTGSGAAGAASGGASSGAPGPSALTDASGTTEITIWHGLGAANGVAFTKLIDQFNTANAGHIHVTATYQGVYADLLAKYTAGLRSGSTPTVLLAGDIATGYLTDVHRSLPAAAMDAANPGVVPLSSLLPAARSYYAVAGTQQAVPMNVSTPMLWVNRDLLTKAGVDPASLTTLDAMAAAARTVHDKTGVAGFTTQDDDWYIEQLTATAGQDFCTPGNGRAGAAPTAVTINTGQAAANITKVADLYRDGVAVDGAPDGSAAIAAFQAGKAAMMLYSSGIAGSLAKGTPFTYSALPYPTSGPAGQSGNVIGGSALWLSATATPAQQVAGWRLEGYLTSAAAQEQFSQATGYIPINAATADSATEKAYLTANPNAAAFLDQVKSTPAVPATAGCVSGAMTTLRKNNISQVQAAFAGSVPVQQALDTAVAQDKQTLADYAQQVAR